MILQRGARGKWVVDAGRLVFDLAGAVFPDPKTRFSSFHKALLDNDLPHFADGRVIIRTGDLQAYLLGRVPLSSLPQPIPYE